MRRAISMRRIGIFVLMMGVGLLATAGQAVTIYYVNASAPGGNGSSWSKAFKSLDSALSAVKGNSSNQFWVAQGTYKPTIKYRGTYTGNESNLVTFNLPNNLAIYGGFAGNETMLSQRNLSAHPTILSGDIANTGSNDLSNAWHVLTADGVKGVLLDSLIITNGYAGGPDAGTSSGRPQFNLVSLDYTFAAGGGLLARHGALVTLNNTRFVNNAADATNATVRTNPNLVPPGFAPPAGASGGGAIAAIDSNTLVTITNSVFDHNNSFNTGGNGGALNTLLEASYSITNGTFTNNSANRIGGAIHGKNAGTIAVMASTIQNNVVTGNLIGDESGGGIGTIDTNLSVSNSQIIGNASAAIAGGGGIFFHQPFDDGEAYAFLVSNSSFSNNQAASIGGGAINITGFHPNAATYAKISNCTFSNNTAFDGGAMAIMGIPTSISSSTFTGNQAGFDGGAIFESGFAEATQLASGTLDLSGRTPTSISNSSFVNNSIVGMPSNTFIPPFCNTTDPSQVPQCIFNIFGFALSSIFLGNPSASVSLMSPGGGAIASEFAGNLSISNSSFNNNSAPNASGGALLIGGSAGTPLAMGQDYVTISNSICSNNTAAVGNNSWLIDSENLNPPSGPIPNGVQFVTDGSCR